MCLMSRSCAKVIMSCQGHVHKVKDVITRPAQPCHVMTLHQLLLKVFVLFLCLFCMSCFCVCFYMCFWTSAGVCFCVFLCFCLCLCSCFCLCLCLYVYYVDSVPVSFMFLFIHVRIYIIHVPWMKDAEH